MFERKSSYYLIPKSEPKLVKPNELKFKTIRVWGMGPVEIAFRIEETDTLANKRITIQHYQVIWSLNWNKTKQSQYIFTNNQDDRIIKLDDSVGEYMVEMLGALYRQEITGVVCSAFVENTLHFLEIENAPKNEQSEFEIYLPHYFRFYVKKIEKSKLKMVGKIMGS